MMASQPWQQALSEHRVVGNDCGGDGAEALIEQEPNGTFTVETKYTDDKFQTTDPSMVNRILEEFDIPKTGWQ